MSQTSAGWARPWWRGASLRLGFQRGATCALLLLAPGTLGAQLEPASTRDVVFRFLAPEDAVEGYRFYLFDEATARESVYDAGAVQPDREGVGRAVVPLRASHPYLVAMTAYNGAGESTRSNALRIGALSVPAFAIHAITPARVGAGRHELRVSGVGFTQKPRVRWENGRGKPPKVRFVRVLDTETLEVGVKVRRKNLEGTTRWDLRLVMRDGREAALPEAIHVGAATR